MKAILFREIKSFFGSPIGYFVIAIFLLMNGFFLWIFPGDYNILDSGFANLNPFFNFSPWVLIFLIPAVTMKSFSDERKQGTLELLLTKPIGYWEIVFGKFFAAVLLIIFAIIPTYIYMYLIADLTLVGNQLDFGATIGSYFGLIFLIFAYSSIGIFASTLSENQIVAFITAVSCCFLFYFGFEALSTVFKDFSNQIAFLGMENHFKSIGRGVIDSRDVVYFFSVSFFFLYLTTTQLKSIQQ